MDAHDIVVELENRTLNIHKMIGLDESQRNFVTSLFSELLLEVSNLYDYTRGIQPNPCKISLIYRSLVESGYLTTRSYLDRKKIVFEKIKIKND